MNFTIYSTPSLVLQKQGIVCFCAHTKTKPIKLTILKVLKDNDELSSITFYMRLFTITILCPYSVYSLIGKEQQ